MKRETKYNIYERGVILALSAIVGIIVSVLAVFLAAALCLTLDLGEGVSSGVSGVCLGIGAITSGFIAAKKIKINGVINGLICGIIIYALIMIISLFVSDNGFSMNSVYHLLVTALSSACGGLLGVLSSERKKII